MDLREDRLAFTINELGADQMLIRRRGQARAPRSASPAVTSTTS